MGANLFDNLAASTFDKCANIMGYDASWTPLAGGPAQTAKVLLNKPTEKRELVNDDFYGPLDYTMEYKDSDFTGLKQSVDTNADEWLTVDSVDYWVRSVKAKFDGKTLLATLEPKT